MQRLLGVQAVTLAKIMRTSLIVTTYNRKEALRCCIESAFRQKVLPDEIVVADDGSREDTAEAVRELASLSPIPLLHVWQPDEGFRAAASRNRGVAASTGDYIVFIDGDMVLHPLFIVDHLTIAKMGQWIQGGRVLLSTKTTERVLVSDEFRLGFWSGGIANRQNAVRSPLLASLFRQPWRVSPIKGVRSSNMSLWRKDIEQVNGFDESFVGWGNEDCEFVVRLANAGVVRRNLKFAAIAFHLYHPEHSRDSVGQNAAMLEDSIRCKRIRCEQGLDQHVTFLDIE